MRYKPNGWRYESARHSLAARGVKTRYFQQKTSGVRDLGTIPVPGKSSEGPREEEPPKPVVTRKERPLSPESALKRALAEKQLRELAEAQVIRERPVQKVIESISAGRFGEQLGDMGVIVTRDNQGRETGKLYSVRDALQSENLTPLEKATIRNALRVKAVELAKSRLPLPEIVTKSVEGQEPVLDIVTKREIDAIYQEQKRAEESPFKSEARELGKKAAVRAVDVAAKTPGAVVGGAVGVGEAGAGTVKAGLKGVGAGLDTSKEFTGLIGKADELEQSPFFRTNALVGNEEDSSFAPTNMAEKMKVQEEGGLTDFFNQASQGVFADRGGKRPTHTDRSTKEVEALYAAKGEFAEVNLRPFEVGKEAFKKGDREGLINAITNLEAEEEKLKDRYYLMEQTRAEILNPRNRVSAYHEEPQSVFGWGSIGGKGAERLAENTKKYNEVKAALKDASNRVFVRKQLLRNDLQRMDATVPPDQTAPGAGVRVTGMTMGAKSKAEEIANTLRYPGRTIGDVYKGGS